MKPIPFLAIFMVVISLWCLVRGGRAIFHPNVVLITVDTLRPDRLGCYGHATNRTPAIDRLAYEGTLFANAYCDIPWTTGSMASVMTGTYGSRHGLQFPNNRLREGAVTLAQILSEHGYETGAIIGSFPLTLSPEQERTLKSLGYLR